MNDQLRKLMIEAGYAAPELAGRANKLAELIIKECIKQCDQVAFSADKIANGKFVTDAGRMLHEGMWGGASNCSAQIKEHFGGNE